MGLTCVLQRAPRVPVFGEKQDRRNKCEARKWKPNLPPHDPPSRVLNLFQLIFSLRLGHLTTSLLPLPSQPRPPTAASLLPYYSRVLDMRRIPPSQQWRGPLNKLHKAALHGSVEHAIALLASGSVGVDEATEAGTTTFMFAAANGCLGVVRILLNRGADPSLRGDMGYSSILLSSW